MKHLSFLRLALILGCVAAFLTACSRDPNVRKQKYFESGQRYYEKGKYREAVIQFSNAVQVDPHFGQAHYQLAQVYADIGRTADAQAEYAKVRQIQSATDKGVDVTGGVKR